MPASNASWFLMILPHVGLTGIYNDCVDGKLWFGNSAAGVWSHSKINQELTVCPSRVDFYNLAYGGMNMQYRANGAGASTAAAFFNRNDGAIGDNSNGIFVSLADVVAGDGAANTLLIAESKRERWMPNTWSQWDVPGLTNCGEFVAVNKNNSPPGKERVIHPDPGGNLLFGFTSSGTVVATTRIVNTSQALFPTTLEQSYANASVGVHPGGANVAFVDGSFRFLREDLPPHIYAHFLTHRSVWNGSSYSTNSARANVFLNALPTTTPLTTNPIPPPKPEDY
jgi:prepilin-type processing-associated H-X9-DG protein